MLLPEEQSCDHAARFLAQLNECTLFAEAISLCLEQTDLRQIELAQRLFVEPATVHNWRTNKRLPDAVMVIRIATGLGLSSARQQMLSDTWRVTRRARELVSCVKEAIQRNDIITILALREEFSRQYEVAQRQLQAAKWGSWQADAEPSAGVHDLDPEIWLYSGY